MPSNVTTRHTGAVDVATLTDTANGVEAGSTATAKTAEIKQGVAENIVTHTEIVPTPVENVRPKLRAMSKPPPFLTCKAAALPIVNDGVGRD